MGEERLIDVFNECRRKLEESGAHFLLLAGKDDDFDGRTIFRAVGAERDDLTVLIITLVNAVPEIRGMFRPSFVEICRHAPESAGGDGDMAAAEKVFELLEDAHGIVTGRDMRDAPNRKGAK